MLGAALVYYLLWRTGALSDGHPLTWTSSEVVAAFRRPGSLPPAPTPLSPSPEAGASPRLPVTAPHPEKISPVPTPSSSDLDRLRRRSLRMPIDGVRPEDLKDSFEETRGGSRRHEALDILAPRGTRVHAADEGRVVKLFTSRQGGITVYQFDLAEEYCYYYAHLDRYAEGLQEGQILRRGDRVGYVGTSGNAPKGTPHLHFSIFKLGPEKRWWHGTPVNPFPVLAGRSSADD